MQTIKDLQNLIKSGRVAHAYLFDGPEESDKLESARAFARMLLCQNLNSCGECLNCKMFDKNTNPNYHLLSVEGNTIKIREHIEPFFQDIQLTSAYSSKKVYIINQAHKMNTASQNSILKTLEEPNSDIVIILLTKNSNLLLPTIISRVIRCTFTLKSIKPAQMSEEVGQVFFDIIKNIESNSAADRILASIELSSQKENYNEILDMMQLYYRNSAIAKYTNNELLINSPKTDKISPEGAVYAVKIIDKLRFALKSNANIQTAMDMLVTKLHDAYKAYL